MEISILLLKQIAELFITMFMGYLLVRFKKIKSEDSKGLSVITLYLVMPCVILNAFQVDFTKEKMQGLMLAFIAAIISHVILLSGTYLLSSVLKLSAEEKASVIYSNAGNLIVPIIISILGQEWVLYASAFMAVQLILLWTHGNSLISGNKKFELKKIYTNVNFVAVFIGIILFFTKIRFPEVISGTISSISKLVGPISMFITGIIIAGLDLRNMFKNKRIYLVTILRMIVFPLIILVVLKCTGLRNQVNQGQTILLVSYLAAITPTASTITQMAQIYDKDAAYVSAINTITILVSIITMPIMVWLFLY